MTLVLSNAEVDDVLSVGESLDVLRSMYAEFDDGGAVTRARSDLVAPGGGGDTYSLKTQDGVVPSTGMAAVRINSDLLHWPEGDQGARREKLPSANGRWVGLVLLFSTTTGAPLAIFPDGVAQRMRVACTSAIAADRLARRDASTLALIGSGWQAETQLLAACAVREFSDIRCYSPNLERCRAFAHRMSAQIGTEVVAVGSADQAVLGADVILCATNAIHPVAEAAWVRPGVHIGVIKPPEISHQVLALVDVAVLHSMLAIPTVTAPDGMTFREAEELLSETPGRTDYQRLPELTDLLAGRCEGRKSPQQSTCFINNGGLGIQFAALGGLIYHRALARGLGRTLPEEWFTEDVHP